MRRARFHEEANRGALFAVDLDVGECGSADQVEAHGRDKTAGDGYGLDGLVEGSRADYLDLDDPLLADDTGESAGD
jgi:hypothetical protein